jgi:hypothetical protein
MKNILKIEEGLKSGFTALIYLSTISTAFDKQIKQVEKWQTKKLR